MLAKRCAPFFGLLALLLTPISVWADEPVQDLLQRLNAVRAEHGLPPLALSPLLTATAQGHVDDLLAHGILGHSGSDGSSLRQRLARAGYRAHWVGENYVVARGAEQAVAWWLDSGPHTRNILHGHYTEIGIGHGPHQWGTLWVLNYGRPLGQPATSASQPATSPPQPATSPPQPEAAAADPGPGASGGSADGAAGMAAQEAGSPPAPSAANQEATPPTEGTTARELPSTHTVQPGETLSAIAFRYGFSAAELARLNGLADPDRLAVGQVLSLAQDPAQDPAQDRPAGSHTVVAGDTLWAIAARHGITVEALQQANGLSQGDLLRIGQVLTLPGSGGATSAPTRTYEVRAGDTLIAIAFRLAVSVDELVRLNGLTDPHLLRVGQILQLP